MQNLQSPTQHAVNPSPYQRWFWTGSLGDSIHNLSQPDFATVGPDEGPGPRYPALVFTSELFTQMTSSLNAWQTYQFEAVKLDAHHTRLTNALYQLGIENEEPTRRLKELMKQEAAGLLDEDEKGREELKRVEEKNAEQMKRALELDAEMKKVKEEKEGYAKRWADVQDTCNLTLLGAFLRAGVPIRSATEADDDSQRLQVYLDRNLFAQGDIPEKPGVRPTFSQQYKLATARRLVNRIGELDYLEYQMRARQDCERSLYTRQLYDQLARLPKSEYQAAQHQFACDWIQESRLLTQKIGIAETAVREAELEALKIGVVYPNELLDDDAWIQPQEIPNYVMRPLQYDRVKKWRDKVVDAIPEDIEIQTIADTMATPETAPPSIAIDWLNIDSSERRVIDLWNVKSGCNETVQEHLKRRDKEKRDEHEAHAKRPSVDSEEHTEARNRESLKRKRAEEMPLEIGKRGDVRTVMNGLLQSPADMPEVAARGLTSPYISIV